MSKWVNTIDVSRCWAEENIPEICADVLKGLGNLKELTEDLEYEKNELIFKFECLQKENPTTDEFNEGFCELYDFCDISLDSQLGGKKIAWVKTSK